MLSNKYRITNYTVLIVLALSAFTPALAFAAPLANNDKDWQYVNGNSWGWNYSPQTQITKDNIDALEVKWLFPLGSRQLAPAGMQAIRGFSEGTSTPPVVRDGTVYVLSNWMRMYAIDAATGKQKWINDYVINFTEIRNKIPIEMGGILHHHGFRYWEGGDALLAYGLACDFFGVDAKTGKQKFWVKDLCLDVPGNLGLYRPTLANSAIIATYEKGRQFIVVLPSRIHSNVADVAPRDSRHITMGISMDAPYKILWRVFSTPPQDRPDKDWALHECDIGYFRDIPCSEAAAVNRAGLEWDFAVTGQPIGWFAGVTGNWGQPAVDEDTGIMYTNTGNQGPYSNMTLAPGPRLYGSTLMAIDMNAGKRVWWLQPFPHDPYDYDCNWSGMLVENPTLGKVYTYGCKEGVYFVIDAANGKPKLMVDAKQDMYARRQISTDPKTLLYVPDPKSYYDMREWNWISYPAKKEGEPGKFCTLPCTVFPSWGNGLFATDRAFDPATQTYFLYESAGQTRILQEHSYFPGESNYKSGTLFTTRGSPPTNSTLVARELATGKVKWTWFYPGDTRERSAPIVSGGMVFTGANDGFVRFFNTNTGQLLREINLGASITVQPTIGKDSSGNSKIFILVGTRLTNTPGSIVSLGLSARAAAEAKTTTVTTTSVTTSTTTAVTTSTTTSATTSTATITTTSATTATTTLTSTQPAKTTTVTSSAPAQTTTVVSSVTQTTGLPAEVTYAAVGVAIIAIAAAAVLVMRKK